MQRKSLFLYCTGSFLRLQEDMSRPRKRSWRSCAAPFSATDEDSPYINSGVMLMNLQPLRAEQDTQEVFDYMDAHKGRLMLPHQDIISALYGQRILPLDPIRCNMIEKLFALHRHNGYGMTLEDVRQWPAVILCCGRNKPCSMAPIDAQLHTAGGHIPLVVNGIALSGENIAVAAMDGQLPTAQIIGNILQPLCLLLRGQVRSEFGVKLVEEVLRGAPAHVFGG